MPADLVRREPGWWDLWFLELAAYVSTASKDPSTQVGCVIVGPDREIRSTGFNGFPRGVADTLERLTNRDLKYPLVCHGEENAILQAARIGTSLKGCSAYVYPWPPCTRCARSLVQAGVTEVVYPKKIDIPERWKADFDLSNTLLTEALVRVRNVLMPKKTKTVEVFHCTRCNCLTFEAESEMCGCGGELHPVSKKHLVNQPIALDKLQGP